MVTRFLRHAEPRPVSQMMWRETQKSRRVVFFLFFNWMHSVFILVLICSCVITRIDRLCDLITQNPTYMDS